MKSHAKTLAVATLLALPLFAFPQNSTDQSSQGTQTAGQRLPGRREAMKMTRARAELMRPLDAKKDQSGSLVQAKLRQKVTLTDGTELPNGTILMGRVGVDDMQQQGMSKLALTFDQAKLKNGTIIPIKATIVGIFGPDAGDDENGASIPGAAEVPNSWTDGTLQVDQLSVISGVDLHSRISSNDSGVFVSTKKDDVKLRGEARSSSQLGRRKVKRIRLTQMVNQPVLRQLGKTDKFIRCYPS